MSDDKAPVTGGSQPGDAGRPARSDRPKVAGVLLLFLFAIAAFQGLFQLLAPPDPEDAGFRVETVRFTVSGTIVSAAGEALPNATVVVVQTTDLTAVTDASGAFRLEGVPSGYNTLNISHPDHANASVRVVLLQGVTVDVRMPPPGQSVVIEHESIAQQRNIARALGVFQLAAGALALAGAISAYQRRRRGLAITGCVAGLVGALPLSIIIAPVAFVLVLRRRTDWNG